MPRGHRPNRPDREEHVENAGNGGSARFDFFLGNRSKKKLRQMAGWDYRSMSSQLHHLIDEAWDKRRETP